MSAAALPAITPWARRGANLQIEVAVENEIVKLQVRGAEPQDSKTFEGNVQVGQLVEQHRQFSLELENLRQAVGNSLRQADQISPKDIVATGAALERLYKHGRNFLDQLTEDAEGFRDFCRRHAPTDIGQPLVVVRSRPPWMLPFEWIPLWRGEPWQPKVVDRETLIEACERFPAFSAQVVRALRFSKQRPSLEGEALRVRGYPEIPVRFFHNRRLSFADSERGIFTPESGFRAVDAWPGAAFALDTAIADFCELLWDEKVDNQIHHFCCHFYASKQSAVIDRGGGQLAFAPERLTADAYLELSEGSRNVKISLKDIAESFDDLKQLKRRLPDAVLPFVFVNACGSSEFTPAGIMSLPYLLLKEDYRGFIGTESRVPDHFASEFSRRFYRFWLKPDMASGALLAANRAMLQEFINPLGILYSEYGDPDLYIDRPAEVDSAR